MVKRLAMFMGGVILSCGISFAQTSVTGKVTSSDDGEPIVGASVKVKGTNTGTATDIDGNFSLNVPADAKLEISYLGMTSKTVKASSNMKVALDPDNKSLDEVVVVGYGSARKIGTITGSIATVNSDKVKNAPSSSALDNLQGQVAGLNVLSSSGEAGDNAVSINLHGIGSLGASSTPLYVLDGIPVSSRTIMGMNPNDIQSISVLKDASATSIYGSRAANGVIYVTTKNGGYNTKATVTYRTQVGWSTLANKGFYEDMMSGDELYNFWLSSGLADAYSSDGDGAAYLKKKYDDNNYRYNTKWYEVFQQFNNPQTQNDLTIQGGGDKVSYLISASQFHQRGSAIGNYYDRYTLRSNIDAKPKTWLRTGLNINLSYDKRQRNGNWGNSENMSNYTSGGLSYLINPLYPNINPETGEEYTEKYPSGHSNPHTYMEAHPYVRSRYGLTGNAYIEIEPIKALKIRSRVGTDLYFLRGNYTSYPSYYANNGSGTRQKNTTYSYSHTMTNTIEYSFDVATDHHFTVLAGHEGVINDYDYYYAQSTGQAVDGLMNLENGNQTSYTMSESATTSKFLSFFGRLDYNLMDRYFIDFTLRNDACSRFGKNNRNATFWALGALWKIKNEEFMKSVNWVNSLDFKVSYGTQGNAGIGDYSALGLVGKTTALNNEFAIKFAQPANNNLTWETQKLFTIGLSGRLWNRFDFDVSYYIRKTEDMLMDIPYPYTTGFSSVTSNVGGLKNTGIDIKLGVDIVRGKDYFVNFSTNFNYNSMKVTELFDGRSRYEIANTMVAYVVGSPVMYYLPLYAGVDPEDGAPMWYKAGDNVDETTKGETTKVFSEAALTQNSGKKRYAPVNGGFSISGGWKGLTLQADFSYVLGKYLVNNDAYFYNNPNVVGLTYNQKKGTEDCWSKTNTNAKFPDWTQGYTLQFDDHLLENASFMRLKNLMIGYSLPQSILNWQNVLHGVKVTFTGRNLFTVTNYGGIDPEVNSNLTYGVTGNSKQYLFGLELTF